MPNGAQALMQTLADAGVTVCFSNPGTSEMHFLAALDTARMRSVLCLFEGVATGAADGWYRTGDIGRLEPGSNVAAGLDQDDAQACVLAEPGRQDATRRPAACHPRINAAFPAGKKWAAAAASTGYPKYIVCNADEGDSGTFADRMVMEGDPFMLIEGMTIAGLAVGAAKGYVYIRSEYPDAIAAMKEAIAAAVAARWLGPNIQGTDKSFTLEIRRGAGEGGQGRRAPGGARAQVVQ